jgi:Fanconi anaemia protein FancD2 nuclease
LKPFSKFGISPRKRSNKKKVSAVTQSSMHPALDEVDNELDEEEETDFEDNDPKQQSDTTDFSLKDLSAYFRELDHSVFILLQEKLVLEPTALNGSSADFGPRELIFLLDDYHQKLEHSLDKKPGLLSEKKYSFAYCMILILNTYHFKGSIHLVLETTTRR